MSEESGRDPLVVAGFVEAIRASQPAILEPWVTPGSFEVWQRADLAGELDEIRRQPVACSRKVRYDEQAGRARVTILITHPDMNEEFVVDRPT